jgi:hypothetical protein
LRRAGAGVGIGLRCRKIRAAAIPVRFRRHGKGDDGGRQAVAHAGFHAQRIDARGHALQGARGLGIDVLEIHLRREHRSCGGYTKGEYSKTFHNNLPSGLVMADGVWNILLRAN